MSDYQDHPAVQALLAKKRPTPSDGQTICPDCDGFGMVRTPGYVQACPRCIGKGLLPLCVHCGEPTKRAHSTSCDCDGAEAHRRAGREDSTLRRWRKQPPVPFALPCYSERTEEMYHDDEYLLEAWEEHCRFPDKLPPIDPEWALLYACEPVHARFCAEDMLEGWANDIASDWDPRDDLAPGAVAALQEALDEWTEEWGSDLGWTETGRPMLPPEGTG